MLALSMAKGRHVGDPIAKLILLLLADQHNDHTNECLISVTLLAGESEASPRTVIRKLDDLEAAGHIRKEARTNEAGGSLPSNFRLNFLPEQTEKRAAEPTVKRLPPRDFQPNQRAIDTINREFPHHEKDFGAITAEWISYCYSANRKYVRFNDAWTNSARGYLRRRSAQPASLRGAGGHRGQAGGVFGAVRDLLEDTGS